MKEVLHVTEELSKKNYSISSLIFFLSDYVEKKIDIKHTILTANFQKNVFITNQKVKIIDLHLVKNFFSINKKISEIIKNADVIHIHGLWRLINFISIFYCNKNNKNFYIHPHGMLLDEALKNKGFLNSILKKILIFFYKLVFSKKVKFISITKKETLSISNFFDKSNIQLIPNPIINPFSYGQINEHKISKTFVFFGRIHPIKNLELMINSFKLAKLNSEWKFHIYGINDDDRYLMKLKNLIIDNSNIEIKKPIFGNKKYEILYSSWANILISKSEVLSLSVLEAASLELPSLVSEQIEIDEFSNNDGISVKLELEKISKKLIDISNWSLHERKIKGKNIKKFIEQNYSIDVIGKKYLEIYNSNYNDQ